VRFIINMHSCDVYLVFHRRMLISSNPEDGAQLFLRDKKYEIQSVLMHTDHNCSVLCRWISRNNDAAMHFKPQIANVPQGLFKYHNI